MPLIRKNYLELTPEQRREGARQVRARIQSALSNPMLTAEQAQQLQLQLRSIDQWEAGLLPDRSRPVKG